ncbi:helix-turn-helix domain-containing protein [Candidatus Odyssella acanthamoebae]|uniref:helix-turn-helix domain-containing protein n=1 Tax=Candidatus Odyssella acanthamoebae TaxID=91604 RepID=UPI0006909414|nr:helix-turn-helix transcriptional regulator [Candidatus Paracaedibacter acanthamoebae]
MQKEKLYKVKIHVGQKLKQQRDALHLSQVELANLLKISPQQLSKYERGADKIPAHRLYQLCKVLGVSPNFFFEGLEDVAISFQDQSIWLSCETFKGQKVQIELCDLRATVSDVKII